MVDQPSPERWARIERLFAEALDADAAERAAFVRRACDDPELHEPVLRLLRAHDSAGEFLAGLGAEEVGELVRSGEAVVPSVMGPYQVIRQLARGGMGIVYLASDVRLGRQVALKCLPPWLESDPTARERFIAEARAASALDHAHIATVHDVGEMPDGGLFIAMAYYDGETLAHRLGRGALGVPDALAFATQIADALTAAHARGIVHRDIKPANVLVTADGAVKVLDFGIAKAPSGPVTRAGERLGTIAYMSPEQTRGEAVDARTDIWSLGALLYELLAGHRPFEGVDDALVIHAIRHDGPPPLGALRPGLPQGVIDLVHRCLEKEPDRRYADARAVLADLRALSDGRTLAPARSARLGRRATLVMIAVVTVAIATSASFGLFSRSSRSPVSPTLDPHLVLVLPFTTAAEDTALARLGRDLVITLSTNLDGLGELRSVDGATVAARVAFWRSATVMRSGLELARELGAGRVVSGSLVRSGSGVRSDIAVYSTAGGPPEVRTAASGSREDIGALTDSMTWALLRQMWPSARAPKQEPNALSTRSLPALRAFLEGEVATAEGRWRDAPDLFARAIELDSVFWLAYVRYADARAYRSQPVDRRITESIWTHRFELPERERARIEAGRADSLSHRLAKVRAVTDRFPDSWRSWFDLAELLIHSTMFLGTTVADARAAMERAVALHPTSSTLWEHHFWMASAEEDTAAMRHALHRMESLALDSASIREIGINVLGLYRGVHRLALSGGEPWPGMGASMTANLARSSGKLDLEDLFGDVSTYGYHRGELAVAEAILHSAVPASAIAGALRSAAQATAGRGAWDSAMVALDRYVARVDGVVPLQHAYRLAVVGQWLGALEPAGGGEWRVALEREAVHLDPRSRAELAWLDGVTAFARADRDGLAAARSRLASGDIADAHLLNRSLAAFELALRGALAEAADSMLELERQRAERSWVRARAVWHPYLTAVNRVTTADWLLATGRPADAARLLRWHDSVLAPALVARADATLRGIVHYHRARAEEALGRTTAARIHYRHVLRELDQPASSLLPLVETARAAVSPPDGSTPHAP